MPAPNTQQIGSNFLLKAVGTVIGGATGGTLTYSTDVRSTATKDRARWQSSTPAMRSWEISHEGLYLEGQEEIVGSGTVIKVAGAQLKGMDQLTISLSQQAAEFAAFEDALWRNVRPTTRAYELSVEGGLIDALSQDGAALAAIQNAKDAGERVPWDIDMNGFLLSGTIAASELTLETPTEERAALSISASSHGALANTAGEADTGLALLLDNFLADNPVPLDVALEVIGDDGAALEGAQQRTGQAWPTAIEVTIPNAEEVAISATLTGTGPLSRSAQAAA